MLRSYRTSDKGHNDCQAHRPWDPRSHQPLPKISLFKINIRQLSCRLLPMTKKLNAWKDHQVAVRVWSRWLPDGAPLLRDREQGQSQACSLNSEIVQNVFEIAFRRRPQGSKAQGYLFDSEASLTLNQVSGHVCAGDLSPCLDEFLAITFITFFMKLLV